MRARLKEYEIPIADNHYLAVRIQLVRGRIVAFVVRLMRRADPDVNLARYDTAHGLPHRDVLGRRRGLVRKDWLGAMSNGEALQFTLADLRSDYERYAEIYEAS